MQKNVSDFSAKRVTEPKLDDKYPTEDDVKSTRLKTQDG